MGFDYLTRRRIALLTGILLIQIGLLAYTFPLTELLSQKLLFHIDNPFHWYVIAALSGQETPNLIAGYDPFFSAGKPLGLVGNESAKFPALIGAFIHDPESATVIWKIYVFALSLLASLCVPLALILLRQGILVTLIGAVFGMLLWWTGMFRWFHTAGMVSFVFVTYASLPYSAYFLNYIRGHIGWHALFLLIPLASLLLLVHPLFPAIMAPVALISLANYRSIRIERVLTGGALIAMLGLLPHWSWLYYSLISPLEFSDNYITHQRITKPVFILMGMVGIWDDAGGAKINPVILLSVLFGYLGAIRKDTSHSGWIYGLVGIIFLLYAQTGGYSSLLARLTQPNRFMPVGYLFLVVPAAIGLGQLWERIKQNLNIRRKIFSIGALSVVLAGLGIGVFELSREVSYKPHGHYGQIPPNVDGSGPVVDHILGFLRNHTDTERRILFETSHARVYDGGHAAGFLALKSGREFIGGPYVQQHFSGFWDHFLFGRDIESISMKEMREYLERYNIGWIVVHSDRSKRYFTQLPGAMLADEGEGISIYRTDVEGNYFFKGTGKIVERGFNRLVLDDLQGDDVLLKYHYIPGLVSDPPVAIEPAWIGDDPNPFVRLLHPPVRVVLRR